ncbi:MAG TPA: hypothetical protein VJT54_05875, partial [Verrucomicrobiae bacterium]|nr:hypothetical protein [Verrucomicrobiae bacterium]
TADKPPGGASVPASRGRGASPKRPKKDAELPPDGSASRLYQTKSKPSTIVDTRVVYCGDWHASQYATKYP